MACRTLFLILAAFVAMFPSGLPAQSEDPPAKSREKAQPAQKEEDEGAKEETKPGEEKAEGPVAADERVVVSASATQQTWIDSPAAVDVLDGEQLKILPADSLADHLRRVPGINVAQFSARDINISSRSATGGINNSTLALADGRTLYQDFLGFVMWEFAPTDPELIDRVEVVRGPASSLWGANAVGGLIHVITKSPRDTPGGRLLVESGSNGLRRFDVRQSFVTGPWALRVSGGYKELDPLPRPETITNFLGQTIDPDLGLIDQGNSGTEQPRVDVRADWDRGSGSRWIFQGGTARTQGWIATGLGPFDIDSSTSNTYLQARFQKGPFETSFESTYFDGNARNLINGIPFDFTSGSSRVRFHGRQPFGSKIVLGWGGEVDRTVYELSIAPGADKRSHAGLFVEANFLLTDKWRILAAAREDYNRETVAGVFSPRLSLQFKPTPDQTLRVAYGEAFRAPSVIETDLSVPVIPVAILNWAQIDEDNVDPVALPLGLFEPLAQLMCSLSADNCGVASGEAPDYIAVTAALGTRDLVEESTQSIELGYAAQFGRVGLSATVYRTRTKDVITFEQQSAYGSGPDGEPGTADDIILPADPDGNGIDEAPPIDICPYLTAVRPFVDLCPLGPVPYNHALSLLLDGLVPSLFQYENGGVAENKGFELGLSWDAPHGIGLTLNYSWQDDPVSDGIPMTERINNVIAEDAANMDLNGDGVVANTRSFSNIPAKHRLSFTAQVDRPGWFAGVSADYVDQTFWQDVLTSDFWAYVPDYTLVGLRGGVRWPSRGLQLTGQVTNLLDEPVQQHVFGDIIDRRVSLSLGLGWK